MPALRPYARCFRRRTADLACFDSALFDAAERPSRFNAFVVARERFADVLWRAVDPALTSLAAFLRVAVDDVPFLGGASLTPARLALDKPIAMACGNGRNQLFII